MGLGRRARITLIAALAFVGCGDDVAPKPDREQIRDLVNDVFDDAAAGDAEGVCAVLTPTGWATAVRRRFVNGRPLRPASEEQCIDEASSAALKSSDLPVAMKNGFRPRVPKIRFTGTGARATVRFTAFYRTWRFRRTDDGWKIDYFSLPVRE